MSATRTTPPATPSTPAASAASPAAAAPAAAPAAPAKAAASKTAAKKPAVKNAAPAKAPAAAKPATPKAAKATPPAAPAKEGKAKKPKLVRDSFTIPKDEYAAIEELKQRTGKLAQTAKKSELLRAGLKLLSGLDDAALLKALQAVPSIKTGRPRAEDKGNAPTATKPAKAVKSAGK